MATPRGIVRSEVIQRMASAVEKGQSANAFIRQMRAAGLGYSNTTMLADYRSVRNVEAKTDLLKYVRKDRLPSPKLYAEVSWDLSREFLYKLKVQARIEPGKPLEEHFVNIVSDRPLTAGELYAEVGTRWGVEYKQKRGQIEKLEVILAVRKVE